MKNEVKTFTRWGKEPNTISPKKEITTCTFKMLILYFP